jgi:hypothetical protein
MGARTSVSEAAGDAGPERRPGETAPAPAEEQSEARQLYHQAVSEWDLGERQGAIALLYKAARLAPHDADVAGALIDALRQLQWYGRALEFAVQLPKEVKRAPLVRMCIGYIASEQKWHARAFDWFGGPDGLLKAARAQRRRSWWLSGGPVRLIRRTVTKANDQAFSTWHKSFQQLVMLDTIDWPRRFDTEKTRARIDGYLRDSGTIYMRAGLRDWFLRAANLPGFLLAVVVLFPIYHGQVLALVSTHPSLKPDFRPNPHGGTLTIGELDIAAALAFATIAVWLIMVPATLLGRRAKTPRGLAARVGVPCVILFVGGLLLTDTEHMMLLAHFAGYAILVVTAFVLAQWSLRVLVVLYGITGLRRLQRRSPREAILDRLISAATLVADPDGDKNDFGIRREILYQIEESAALIERDLPAQFESGGYDTDEWLAGRARGAATAVRDLNRQVAVSSGDSWVRLGSALRHEIGALASGDLAALRWAPARPGRIRRNLRQVAVASARTITVMALPLIIVFVFGPVAGVDAHTLTLAKIATVGWAVLCLLFAIDPTLQRKIDAAKDLTGLLQTNAVALSGKSPAAGQKLGPD